MTPDLDHLLPPYRPLAIKPGEERKLWIQQDRWIHYHRADQALKRFDELLCYPQRVRMPLLLLTGNSGIGKTHIVQRFVRDHPPEFDQISGNTRLRVVAMQMTPEPLEKDFYDEFLTAMGAINSLGSVVSVRSRCRSIARQLGLRLLIIDEIHSILAGTFRQQRIFLNSIRYLANDLLLPLVCVGTHEAQQALMTDDQLRERFAIFELPVWRDNAVFAQLLTTFGSLLPLRLPSDLCDPKLRQKLLAMSDGITVRICRLLEEAAIRAIQTGTERITLESFDDNLADATLASISDRKRRRKL